MHYTVQRYASLSYIIKTCLLTLGISICWLLPQTTYCKMTAIALISLALVNSHFQSPPKQTDPLFSFFFKFYFIILIKYIGVILANNAILISGVQLDNTSVYCISCAHHRRPRPLSLPCVWSPLSSLSSPHLPPPQHSVVCVTEFEYLFCFGWLFFCFISHVWVKPYGSCSFLSDLFH